MIKTAAREAYARYKQSREFITHDTKEDVGPELSQYANKVRNFELGGAGLGALLGGGLGAVIGRGKLPGIALGGVAGGLLGKGGGRYVGEGVGLQELGAQLGIPLERDPNAAIIQR